MGSICLHSTQVTAKNSIKVKSPCFGTATEADAGTKVGTAEGLISTLACELGTGVTAGVDGEHAATNTINMNANGKDFRNI